MGTVPSNDDPDDIPDDRRGWSLSRLADTLPRQASAPTQDWLAGAERWIAEVPPTPARFDRVAVEVGYHRGANVDGFPVTPPTGLEDAGPWFALGVVRWIGEEPTQDEHGIELWFPDTAELSALRQLPEWDTGNLLGLNFVADAGPSASTWWNGGLLRQLLNAFESERPTAIQLFGTWLENETRLR